MVGLEKFIHQLLYLWAKLLGSCFGVMDLEARHTEFFLRIVGIEGGELAEAPQSAMCGNRLAVFRESDSELLTDTDKRHRIEVFLHLDMAVGMDFGPAPLAYFEGRADRSGFKCFFSSSNRSARQTP